VNGNTTANSQRKGVLLLNKYIPAATADVTFTIHLSGPFAELLASLAGHRTKSFVCI